MPVGLKVHIFLRELLLIELRKVLDPDLLRLGKPLAAHLWRRLPVSLGAHLPEGLLQSKDRRRPDKAGILALVHDALASKHLIGVDPGASYRLFKSFACETDLISKVLLHIIVLKPSLCIHYGL